MGILVLDFHFPTTPVFRLPLFSLYRSPSPELWKCGNLAFCAGFPRRCGKGGKPVLSFPCFPHLLHFHSSPAAFPCPVLTSRARLAYYLFWFLLIGQQQLLELFSIATGSAGLRFALPFTQPFLHRFRVLVLFLFNVPIAAGKSNPRHTSSSGLACRFRSRASLCFHLPRSGIWRQPLLLVHGPHGFWLPFPLGRNATLLFRI